jgi:uncharacterized membrane protein
MPVLVILSRWLHVVAACLVIGGVFFTRLVLPQGLSILEPDLQTAVLLRTRRAFKMVIHSSILLLLLTGTFNGYLALPTYNLNPPLLHSLLGLHVLLGLIAFALVLYVLAGKRPPPSHRMIVAVNLAVLLLAVAAASTLKWAREKTVLNHVRNTSASDSR